MKRRKRIWIYVLLILLAAAAAVVIWQRQNIRAVYTVVTADKEAIARDLEAKDTEKQALLDRYDVSVTLPTMEQREQMIKGKLSAGELKQQMGLLPADEPDGAGAGKTGTPSATGKPSGTGKPSATGKPPAAAPQSADAPEAPGDPAALADALVSDCIRSLCELQADMLAQLGSYRQDALNEWNALSKEIEEIQAKWRTIGFATRKENQKVYDRFRAACDKFFERKRASFTEFKDSMNANLEKKMAIITEAESLKDSTDWKATSDRFIELQKEWKEIGAVPRKKSEQIWKRFRAACDAFFTARDNRPDGPGSLSANLSAKKALIEAIKAYTPADAEADAAAAKDFAAKWNEIGFVPFKEKDKVQAEYRDAMQAKFPDFGGRRHERGGSRGAERRPLTEKDKLKEQFNALQQEIQTYENNIGFFGLSKGAEKLKAQMQERIDAAKAKLEDLKAQIRAKEQEETQE